MSSTNLGAEVRSAITDFTRQVVDQVATGTIPPEAAVGELSAALDMAVRRDPGFAAKIGFSR